MLGENGSGGIGNLGLALMAGKPACSEVADVIGGVKSGRSYPLSESLPGR